MKNLKLTIDLLPKGAWGTNGVKHYRHSQMIGYGEHAKRHFCKINNCYLHTFAQHFLEAEQLFNKRNTIEKWTIKTPQISIPKNDEGVV